MCNLCSLPLISGNTQQNENDGKYCSNSGSQSDEDNSEDISGENINKKTPPTLALKVYEGPVYSPEDDVVYYRVKADITGNPFPQVSFSKDDSEGAWGPLKVQVNLKEGQTYNLTATASNSEGEKTDEILLGWDGVIEDQINDDHNDGGQEIVGPGQDEGEGENMKDTDRHIVEEDGQDREFNADNFRFWRPTEITQEAAILYLARVENIAMAKICI